MRRRFSLALVAVLVIVAVAVSTLYLGPRMQASRRVASTSSPRDTIGATDSAEQASSRQDRDTMCFASRIGLPCDPR